MKRMTVMAAAALLVPALYAAGGTPQVQPKPAPMQQGAIKTAPASPPAVQPKEQTRGREYMNTGEGKGFQQGVQTHDGSGSGMGHK